ncbi:hypothetical protein [Nocardia sp. NPDC024068]|uniref:hypothetical protein n=1 Tax=Nocardia sp. NPDC024068 TaxID=3157197 RepID=UPI0033FD57F0
MTESDGSYEPPTESSEPVETDPVALSSAEDLDEDPLHEDPLEKGMDPPEHWSGVDKYGMTTREQAEPRALRERLAEEEPDTTTETGDDPRDVPDDERSRRPAGDLGPGQYEQELGIAADIPGGSVPDQIQEPPD